MEAFSVGGRMILEKLTLGSISFVKFWSVLFRLFLSNSQFIMWGGSRRVRFRKEFFIFMWC